MASGRVRDKSPRPPRGNHREPINSPNAKPELKGTFVLKILGFNDFHGHLAEGSKIDGRPVGGAAVLAAYLKAAMRGKEAQSLIIHAGDQVGASPPNRHYCRTNPRYSF